MGLERKITHARSIACARGSGSAVTLERRSMNKDSPLEMVVVVRTATSVVDQHPFALSAHRKIVSFVRRAALRMAYCGIDSSIADDRIVRLACTQPHSTWEGHPAKETKKGNQAHDSMVLDVPGARVTTLCLTEVS